MQEKTIVICGGVGPMAGVALHKKIIENTLTDGTDQTHFEIHHLSRSNDIPDRTKYLLGEIQKNPAEGMARTIEIASKSEKITGKQLVAGIPCNTFHAPKIFDNFLKILQQRNIHNVEIVHMLHETVNYIRTNYPDIKKLGLMSTTGTRKVRVYNQIFEPLGYTIIEVPNDIQDELHDSIYNTTWGIKAVSPVTKKARDNFENYVHTLIENGAEAVILGCTEIPLALPEKNFNGTPLIDPMTALAQALIKKASPERLMK